MTAGQPVRANDWFYFFSFDVMGDFAFGKPLNMLTTEKWQYTILLMREFLSYLGPLSPVPWVCRLGFGFPGMAPGWKRFCEYCKARMDERIEVLVPSSHMVRCAFLLRSTSIDRS